ncbi:MAG: hypothetical protein LBH01_01050 [Verrucomicrobiales bacterium]|jgi:hypothetical protein|nr:hypothetical protein [Verrucomicrobiales bacterium]
MKNREFWRQLHARGETAETLARKIYSSRAHVTLVLNGSRSGGPTRRKLGKILPGELVKLLGWEEDAPHGTKFHVTLNEKQPTGR